MVAYIVAQTFNMLIVYDTRSMLLVQWFFFNFYILVKTVTGGEGDLLRSEPESSRIENLGLLVSGNQTWQMCRTDIDSYSWATHMGTERYRGCCHRSARFRFDGRRAIRLPPSPTTAIGRRRCRPYLFPSYINWLIPEIR